VAFRIAVGGISWRGGGAYEKNGGNFGPGSIGKTN